MKKEPFKPTAQQHAIIRHNGSAFISACPGAGKTRVMAERARFLFKDMPQGRGVAFLSFTKAAIFELDTLLKQQRILTAPVFPNFIGTFDSFVWQFLIAPFGVNGSDARPCLIADLTDFLLTPFQGAHPLPLSCFDPHTNKILPDAAKLRGFNLSQKQAYQVQAYETSAKSIRADLQRRGYLGFDNARNEALKRLDQSALSARLVAALAGRFCEVIVDEAQDCNPDDLKIIAWLRKTNIPVKVVCDPHQSIYEFRGGVTDHLFDFEDTFAASERIGLTGNFRSSANICKAIAQLRPLASRGIADDPMCTLDDETAPIHILSYAGRAVSASIGTSFSELLRQSDIDIADSPVLAATKASGAAAVGQPRPSKRRDRAVRLAEAVTDFHFASGFNDIKAALDCVHEIILDLEGHLANTSYHQYLSVNGIDPVSWRPKIIAFLRELRFDPAKHQDARAWHAATKTIVGKRFEIPDGQSLSQKLKWNAAIETALAVVPGNMAMPRTIH
jgi:superfamily I DNA/RNA helicase